MAEAYLEKADHEAREGDSKQARHYADQSVRYSGQALRKAADYMKKNPDVKLRIEGNCDERGTSEYNMALGDRRAASAKKYLTSLGIDAGRLSTVSYGKERPVCAEHNEECWQRNRRGDFMPQK